MYQGVSSKVCHNVENVENVVGVSVVPVSFWSELVVPIFLCTSFCLCQLFVFNCPSYLSVILKFC